MGRRHREGRRTAAQAAADRESDELAGRLGRMLKDGRQQPRLSQQQASALAGLSPSAWSWLEVGRDGRVTMATWNRAAMAVGSNLKAYLERASAADQPRDAAHLRNQELILRIAAAGGWRGLPEAPIDREARTSRAADVLLHRACEYGLVEVWDWFDDVGAALRDWDRRLDAVERYAIARMVGDEELPRVGGCWVVRATQRNQRLVQEHRHVFRARFDGSATQWLAALTSPAASMPAESALLWVTVRGDRLYPSRLG